MEPDVCRGRILEVRTVTRHGGFIMKTLRLAAICRIASASPLIFLATIALARTVPVIDARPNDSSDPVTCYRWFPAGTSNTGLQRVCAGTYAVDIPLSVDTAGDKNILVWGSRPKSTAQLSCNAWSVTAQGGYTPGAVIDLTT